MADKRQHDARQAPDAWDIPPNLAIRRHTDRCFHAVEEVVYAAPAPGDKEPGGRILGYILDGVMIDPEDIAEVRPIP